MFGIHPIWNIDGHPEQQEKDPLGISCTKGAASHHIENNRRSFCVPLAVQQTVTGTEDNVKERESYFELSDKSKCSEKYQVTCIFFLCERRSAVSADVIWCVMACVQQFHSNGLHSNKIPENYSWTCKLCAKCTSRLRNKSDVDRVSGMDS